MSKEAYKKWYENNKDRARKMKREAMRKYRAENPSKYRLQSRNAKAVLKNKVFEIYGRSCILCGFSDERALTLDHVLNNGSIERKEYGERGVYYRSLLPEYKKEYQTLCMNCQFIKRVQWRQQHGVSFSPAP